MIVPDRPGYGYSTRHISQKIVDWADDLNQLADSIEIPEYHLIGFSAGAPYALACSLRHPEKLSSLTLISPAPPMDKPSLRKQMLGIVSINYLLSTRFPALFHLYFKSYWSFSRKNPDHFLKLAISQASEADQEVMKDELTHSMLEAVWRENLRIDSLGYSQDATLLMKPWGFDLTNVRMKVTIVWGEQDLNTPVSIQGFFTDQLSQVETIKLKDQGHFCLIPCWDEILEKTVRARQKDKTQP